MLKDLLFPKFCLSCGFLGSYVCLSCEKKLVPITNDICLYCGKNSYLGLTHPACKKNYGIDGVLSMFHYNPTLKAIIKNIKYRGVYDACTEFFQLIHPSHIHKFYQFRRTHPTLFLQPIPRLSRSLYRLYRESRASVSPWCTCW